MQPNPMGMNGLNQVCRVAHTTTTQRNSIMQYINASMHQSSIIHSTATATASDDDEHDEHAHDGRNGGGQHHSVQCNEQCNEQYND